MMRFVKTANRRRLLLPAQGAGAADRKRVELLGLLRSCFVRTGPWLQATPPPGPSATKSIMGAISRSMAGIGSAVDDYTRLFGGTLGMAVIGRVYASAYGSRLTTTLPAAVPAQATTIAAEIAQITRRGFPLCQTRVRHGTY